jgi:hypothetical protein
VSTSQESISRHPIFTAYLERAPSISAPNTTVDFATTGGEAPQSKIDRMYHNTVKEHGDPHTLISLLEISHAWTSTTHLKVSAQAKAATSLLQLGIHRESKAKSPISVRIQEFFLFEPQSPTSKKKLSIVEPEASLGAGPGGGGALTDSTGLSIYLEQHNGIMKSKRSRERWHYLYGYLHWEPQHLIPNPSLQADSPTILRSSYSCHVPLTRASHKRRRSRCRQGRRPALSRG